MHSVHCGDVFIWVFPVVICFFEKVERDVYIYVYNRTRKPMESVKSVSKIQIVNLLK